MCGIFGYVSIAERDPACVLEGLKYLEYRGYDSWGIAVATDERVTVEKAIGKIADARIELPPAKAALGHTRWATHGAVTQANAHPHLDCRGRFALIHNGIVENYRELGSMLQRSHNFQSQTDTEVLVHLLEEELDGGQPLIDALVGVFRRVEGLSAVAVLDGASGEIAVAKNGSPLTVGWDELGMFLASDAVALLDHTRSITFLEDGQAAVISATGLELREVTTDARLEPEIRQISWDTQRAGLDGYEHFMLKEINEQPRVLRTLASAQKRESILALADYVRAADDVFLIGCGTAHNAALSGRYMLAEIAERAVTAVMASEMNLIYPMLGPESLVIALSQSGETIDVLEAVRGSRARGAKVAALVNAEGSSLDRFADLSVPLDCGPERCVLATKSYTAKLAILYLLAQALAGHLEEGARRLEDAAVGLEEVLEREKIGGPVRAAARAIGDHQHLFVIGRHENYPLALEAALKIKEVSYIHAEGFASGELKHGVIALVAPGTPVLVLAPDENFRREALAAAAEVGARGALVVGVSPREEAEFDILLPLTPSGLPWFEVAALTQLLAYELALLRGCDPDRPRNLAKSVTVK